MAFTRVRGPGITTDDNYRVGILTATKFVGPIETTVDSDFTNINVTGISTVDGVKIGDPSGIVTASSSSGIVTYYGDASKLTGLTAGQIPNLDGAKITTGTVAAARIDNLAASKITSGTVATARLGSGTANNTSFLRGDQTWASNTSTTINNNADNRIITGSGTADTLEAESNLTYNGSNLQFNTTANGHAVILKSTGNYYNKLSFDSGNTAAGGELAYVDFSWDGDKVADIQALAGDDVGNKDDGHLVFRTSPSQGNIAERLRITKDGRLGIGITNPTAYLHVGAVNSSSTPNLYVRNHTAGGSFNGNYGSEFRHAYGSLNHCMLIHTQEAHNYRRVLDISDSNGIFATFTHGKLGVGTTLPSNKLDVQAGATNTAIVARSTDSKAQISLLDNSTTSVGSVVIGAEGDALFLTSGSGGAEAFRIHSDGKIGIGLAGGTPDGLFEVYNSSTGGNTVLKVHNDKTGDAANITLEGKRTSDNDTGQVLFRNNNYGVAAIFANAGGSGNHDGGYLKFFTSEVGSGNVITEKLRITSDGYVGVKRSGPLANLHTTNNELALGTNPASAAAPNATYDGLVVDGSAGSWINIRSRGDGNSAYGRLAFSDDTRGRGHIEYRHKDGTGDDWMGFQTAGAERLRIDSLGVLQIKQTTNTNQGIEWYSAGGAKSASIGWGNGNANFEFKNFRQDSQADGPYGNIDFFTGSSSSPPLVMRMQVTGEVGINTTNPTAKLHVRGGQDNISATFDNHIRINSHTDGSTLVKGNGVTYVSGTGGQSDGNWRDIFTNWRYSAGSFVAAIGDTTVKTMISGHFYITAPNYGVVVWNEITNNNAWNSGIADMQIVTHNTSNYKLQIKHTSYYNTSNNFAYYIMFNFCV